MFLHSNPESKIVFKNKSTKYEVDVETLKVYCILTLAHMRPINDKVP